MRASLPTILCFFGAQLPAQTASLETQELSVRSASGNTVRALACRLKVPERRDTDRSRTIELAFARLLSTAKQPGPPLIYLHGGPGGSATGAVRNPNAIAVWEPFLALGDVILLDQRGTGRSRPALARPLREPPSPTVMRSRSSYEDWLAKAGRQVLAELRKQGIDIRGYNTEESADDIDAVRRAVGAAKMRLLGFSYGTHLGLSVLRRHASKVDAAVLVGVEGPDETQKLPSTYDAHIKKLSAMIAADPAVRKDVPDFEALLRRVLAKLDRTPIEVRVPQPLTGKMVPVQVGSYALRMMLVRDFGDTSDLPVFPRLLYSIDNGDASVLTWFVRKRYSGMRGFPTLAFTMDPASGCPADRSTRIAREAKNAVLGNAMNFVFPKVTAVFQMPVLGEAFRSPLASSVRTLFISGELDANTPPYQAERMRWGFTRSTHLVQRYGGHEDWLRNRKVHTAILEFLRGKDVARHDVDLPNLRFIPVQGPPRGVSHPAIR